MTEGHLWSWTLGVKKSGDENSHFWGQPRCSWHVLIMAVACGLGNSTNSCSIMGLDTPARISATCLRCQEGSWVEAAETSEPSNQNCCNWLTTEVSAPLLYFSIAPQDKHKKEKHGRHNTKRERMYFYAHMGTNPRDAHK